MSITVVTTCSRKGYLEYGKRCVDSFLRRWPTNAHMVFYAEDPPYDLPVDDRLVSKNLFVEVPECRAFVKRNAHLQAHHFRFDAVRFCYKVYALCDALRKCSTNYLVWLDADVYTHSTIPPGEIERLIPSDKFIAYLDRKSKPPETGFILFNLTAYHRALANEIANQYQRFYSTDVVFSLKEWHDGYVFGQLMANCKSFTFNLAEGIDSNHPFVNSKLGQWMDHLKGKRKQHGRTSPEQIITPDLRKLEYWK